MLAIYGTGRYGTLVRQATRMRLSEQPVRPCPLPVPVQTAASAWPRREARDRAMRFDKDDNLADLAAPSPQTKSVLSVDILRPKCLARPLPDLGRASMPAIEIGE